MTARVVSRFEARLLRILRFFLRREPAAAAVPLVFGRCPAPHCLGRAAVELIQDTLARGCVGLLARASGWRRGRQLRDGRVAEGRLWQRTRPVDMGLSFSEHTLRFLIWVTAADPADKGSGWPDPPQEEQTAGDLLLLYYAFGALHGTREGGPVVRARALFARNPLVRLAYPEVVFGPAAAPKDLDFRPWTAGPPGCILEALQQELAGRWLEAERRKARIADWQEMQAVGRSQERVLAAFLQAVEEAGRLDLARFLLVVLAQSLRAGDAGARRWLGGLTSAGVRLADRQQTYRAALVLPLLAQRLQRWDRQARGVAFFDEGYPASQLWKADWEDWQGDALCRRAAAVLREAEPFAQTEGQA
jgi:hypothetical protein